MTIIQAREDAHGINIEELKAFADEAKVAEARAVKKLGRMARGASNTDSKLGTIGGTALGLVAGFGLASGLIPTSEAMAGLGGVLPLASGLFFAAIGLLVGTYLDLHGVANRD
jgi:hypothetical protein